MNDDIFSKLIGKKIKSILLTTDDQEEVVTLRLSTEDSGFINIHANKSVFVEGGPSLNAALFSISADCIGNKKEMHYGTLITDEFDEKRQLI